jgi:hypothetical protein
LCNCISGYENLGVDSPQKEEKDHHYIWTLESIIVKQLSKVKAKLKFHPYYFPMAKLLLGLYDYRSKHLGILEELNVMTPTNFLLNHFNHERVVKCPDNTDM